MFGRNYLNVIIPMTDDMSEDRVSSILAGHLAEAVAEGFRPVGKWKMREFKEEPLMGIKPIGPSTARRYRIRTR